MRTGRKELMLIIPSEIVSRGIKDILEESGDFFVTGIMHHIPREGDEQLKNIYADAIVLDPSVFGCGEMDIARQIIAEYSNAPVVALQTCLCDEDYLHQYDAVVSLYDAPAAISRKVMEAIQDTVQSKKSENGLLSAREKEILVCVAKGMQNKEIADRFNISTYTVITHRKNISRKTGIRSVAGLTVYALLNNLIDLNESVE